MHGLVLVYICKLMSLCKGTYVPLIYVKKARGGCGGGGGGGDVVCEVVGGNMYNDILVAPCFKNLLRLEAGYPALRCHVVKQNTEEEHTPQRLERIPPGFGLVGIIIRDRNNFSAPDKRPASAASSFRAACGQGGRAARGARAAGSEGRGAAPAQPPAAGDGPAARGAPAAVR